VIKSFADKDTEKVFNGGRSKKFDHIKSVAFRKLAMVHTAQSLTDLKAPPANKLEALIGDRVGQHGIRINDKYRVCFVWKDDGAHDVEIVDYH
jgi:proteic killer suppression protein